ncbi:hypothetical protein [Vibrio jasicida]
MKNNLHTSILGLFIAAISTGAHAHGKSHIQNYAAVCPTLVQQYEDSIPSLHRSKAKLVKTKDIEIRTLFITKDSLKTVMLKCPTGSRFMNNSACRFDESGIFVTKDLVRPAPIEDSDFGNVGRVYRKQYLYECKFSIGYTLD